MIFSRKYEIPINLTPNSKLRENVIEIRDKVEFRGILLILPGQTKETRPLRSQIIQDSDRESATTTIIIRKILLQFADYMNKLKIKISERFQWPEWVTGTKDCFDFVCSNDKLNQEETLGKLLNLLKTPITEEKKIVIMEQYIGVRYCANEYLKGLLILLLKSYSIICSQLRRYIRDGKIYFMWLSSFSFVLSMNA